MKRIFFIFFIFSITLCKSDNYLFSTNFNNLNATNIASENSFNSIQLTDLTSDNSKKTKISSKNSNFEAKKINK